MGAEGSNRRSHSVLQNGLYLGREKEGAPFPLIYTVKGLYEELISFRANLTPQPLNPACLCGEGENVQKAGSLGLE